MGISTELLVDPSISDEFLCSICQDVLELPTMLKPCEHVFCESCVQRCLQDSSLCPVCRQENTGFIKPQRVYMNLLNGLRLHCPFMGDGCNTIWRLDAFLTHRSACEFNPDIPRPCAGDCGAKLGRLEGESHNCIGWLKEQLESTREDWEGDRRELMSNKTKVKELESIIQRLQQKLESSKIRVTELEFVIQALQREGLEMEPRTPARHDMNTDLKFEEQLKLPYPLRGHSAVYDGQDSIYIIGTDQGKVLRFSLGTGLVEEYGDFVSITNGGAALSTDGEILYFGGQDGSRIQNRNVYSFSVATKDYRIVGSLPNGMTYPGIAQDPLTEAVYIIGGHLSDQILQYEPYTRRIEHVAFLPGGLYGHGTVWDVNRRKVYMFGGTGHTGRDATSKSMYQFTPNDARMDKLNATLPTGLYYISAVSAQDKTYILGTYGMVQFDPRTQLAEAVRVHNYPKYIIDAACVYVPALSRIYVFGGRDLTSSSDRIAYIDLTTDTTSRVRSS